MKKYVLVLLLAPAIPAVAQGGAGANAKGDALGGLAALGIVALLLVAVEIFNRYTGPSL